MHVKHVIKSVCLIHFCLTVSIVFGQMSQTDSASAEKSCVSHLYKSSIEWLQTCSSGKELITVVN